MQQPFNGRKVFADPGPCPRPPQWSAEERGDPAARNGLINLFYIDQRIIRRFHFRNTARKRRPAHLRTGHSNRV
ncbi:MAG TPA: hypothetical protein PK760_01815 [Flavobacteriales bacterium]|nr:hypothetical protein [Flavobacteriales bacterium]